MEKESVCANFIKLGLQDYEATHRDIELLKLRSFTIGKKFPESVFMAEDGQDQIAEIVQAMVPFVGLGRVMKAERMVAGTTLDTNEPGPADYLS